MLRQVIYMTIVDLDLMNSVQHQDWWGNTVNHADTEMCIPYSALDKYHIITHAIETV